MLDRKSSAWQIIRLFNHLFCHQTVGHGSSKKFDKANRRAHVLNLQSFGFPRSSQPSKPNMWNSNYRNNWKHVPGKMFNTHLTGLWQYKNGQTWIAFTLFVGFLMFPPLLLRNGKLAYTHNVRQLFGNSRVKHTSNWSLNLPLGSRKCWMV